MTRDVRPGKTSVLTCRPGPDHITGARHCTVGAQTPRRSKRDNAKACAAQRDIAVHHRLNQARLAIARISRGSERTLARANCLRKSCASSDHLPPVSHARTTRRARLAGRLDSMRNVPGKVVDGARDAQNETCLALVQR